MSCVCVRACVHACVCMLFVYLCLYGVVVTTTPFVVSHVYTYVKFISLPGQQNMLS